MSSKFRYFYLLLGAAGLGLLFYYVIGNLADPSTIDPVRVLSISVPDMAVFFLAYRTYPSDPQSKRQRFRRFSNR